MHWQTTRFQLDLSQPRVMGIVNLTPDSFFDGGRFNEATSAVQHAERLLAEGADILDLGGESSRPGAPAVNEAEEWRRVEPVLRVVLSWNCPVSLDTTKPGVMRRALDAGVDIVNDIQALRAPGALEAVAGSACGVCLMHMQGGPQTMQDRPAYDQVVDEVLEFLTDRTRAAFAAGIAAERIVLDPGIGFGKTVSHNFKLLAEQSRLHALGRPLLVGWSRKSSLGAVTGRAAADDRLPASLAAALAAVLRGARVLRVHDVGATVDALKVWRAAGLPYSP